MLTMSQQELEAKLLLIETTVAAIRIGAGLTASAPCVPGTNQKIKHPAKKSNEKLKHETGLFIAKFLNRPDFINYLK